MIKTKIVLFKSKTLKDGTYPVMLRFTQGKKSNYMSLEVSCLPDQWDDAQLLKSNFPNSIYQNNRISDILTEARRHILKFTESGEPYTAEDIIRKLKGETTEVSFNEFTNKEIRKMKEAKQLGNAAIYESTLKQLKKYRGEQDLKFGEINYKFLTELEAFFRSRDNKTNTISLYIRTIRAIFNRAIKQGLIPATPYPFEQYKIKYQDPMKRAITKEDMQAIKNLELKKGSPIWIVRSLFMFSFYTMGMNIIDMALLKLKDIRDGQLYYQRKKTGFQYRIKVTSDMKAIIDHFSAGKKRNDYLFPIVYHKETELIRDDIRDYTRHFNYHLKQIAKRCGIQAILTSYVARHTWATLANRGNVNLSLIKEGLGHTDIKTTQTYLAKFGSEELDKANEMITDL